MKRIHLLLLMAVLLFTGCQPKSELDFNVNGVKLKMIRVEGGTFTMGENSPSRWKMSPAHHVTLSDYYIGQTEVTQELWEAVMGSNPSYNTYDSKNPVEQVSWNAIVKVFIPKLNALTGKTFSLPTEAQWEFAARGGNMSQGYQYSGSNNIDDVAWYDGNSYCIHPVGQKKPNELGIYDMTGNVQEWCTDLYGEYSAQQQINPIGPESRRYRYRVLRGGSYGWKAKDLRIPIRNNDDPRLTVDYCGFRLVLADPFLNKSSLSMYIGEKQSLFVSVNGIVPVNSEFVWSSSNPSCITVDEYGDVEALDFGQAVITAKEVGTGKKYTCEVGTYCPKAY